MEEKSLFGLKDTKNIAIKFIELFILWNIRIFSVITIFFTATFIPFFGSGNLSSEEQFGFIFWYIGLWPALISIGSLIFYIIVFGWGQSFLKTIMRIDKLTRFIIILNLFLGIIVIFQFFLFGGLRGL